MSRYTVTGRDWSRPHTDTGNRLRHIASLPMAPADRKQWSEGALVVLIGALMLVAMVLV